MIKQKYLDEFITEYCINTNITLEQLKSKSRKIDTVEKRMIAAYFLRNKVGMTFIQVGNYLHKNHASIIHYIKLTERFIDVYPHIKKLYNEADKAYDKYKNHLRISYQMPDSIAETEQKLIDILLNNNEELKTRINKLEKKLNEYES